MEKVPQQEPSRGEPGAEQEAQKAQEARSSNVDEHVHVGNSRMPAHTRRRLEYSLRTAWTTAICLTLIYYFAWSNIALSLSPVISVISAVLYFGQWQQAAVKVAYSSVVGAAIGVVVGFSYQTKPLFLVLFFFAMAWINRASKWDRTSMVLGSLALVLCALWPILTDGEYTGLRSFYSAIALINVPWLITGASLLFPFPALAIFSAKDQVLVVTRKMSLMLSALVRAFNEQDQADLFVAEYDELAVEMAEDFATLTQLTAHCSSEVILFPSARDLPPALCLLNETLRRIVCELDGLRDSVASIEHSRTQAKFSSLLRPVLADIAEETHLCATLVGDFFDTFRPIPGVIRRPLMWLWARLGGCCSCLKTHDLSRRSQRRVREIYGIQPSHVLLRRQFTRTSLSSKARNRSDSAPHTVYIDPDSFSHYSFSPSACHSCGMQEPPSMDVASLLPTGTASVFFDGGVGGELRGFGATTTTTDGADVDTETSLDKALGLDFLQSAARLLVLRSKMLHDYQEGRRRYIFIGEQGGGEGEGFGDGGGDGGEGKEERMDGPRLRTHRGRPTQGADEGGGGGAGGGVGAGIRAGADAGAGAGTGVDAGAGTGAGTEGGSRVRFGSSLDLQLEANLTAELTLAADVTLNPSPGGRGEEKSPKSPKRGDIGDIESASLGMQEWGREHLIVSALHEMHHLHTQSQQAQLSRPSLVERSVREETLRLSLRNFGPRAAYLHKLSVIVELVASYKDVFVQRGEAWSALGSVWAYTFAVLEYVLDTGAGFVSAGGKIMRGLTRQDVSVWYRDFRLRYTNACKIALAVTIAASLLVFDLAPGLYNGGLWTTIVIVLVRQDKTASSFLTGFQRLEGTVIGAIFSFVLYNFLKCDTTHCGPDRVITPIVAWVALCSLFREGPMHGYSATVAAFTPILLVGVDAQVGLDGAWGRVEETFTGLTLYLLVDNLVLPQRTYTSIKAAVLRSVTQTKAVFGEAVGALEGLLDLKDEEGGRVYNGGHWSSGSGESGSSRGGGDSRGNGSGDGVDETLEGGTPLRTIPEQTSAEGGIELTSSPHSRSHSNSDTNSNSNSPSPGATGAARAAVGAAGMTAAGSAGSGTAAAAGTAAGTETVGFTRGPKRPLHPANIRILRRATAGLDSTDLHLAALAAEVAAMQVQIAAVQHEPELWYRKFPSLAYSKLLQRFDKVRRSGQALSSGARAFSAVLCQMLERGQRISQHLAHFRFMINHLFAISSMAQRALSLAREALERLYQYRDFHADLSALVLLRRSAAGLMRAVNVHFRDVYLRQSPQVLLNINPYFNVALSNVFEAALAMTQDLSDLGMALHAIRNTEAIMTI